jgi:spoIIIJ-associated protein
MSEAQGVPYSRQEALRTILRQTVVDMGLDIRVKIRESEGVMRGILAGPDTRFLRSQGGAALKGMQHLVTAILSQDPRFQVEAVVEIEGMREEMDERLRDRAYAAAAEVRRSGEAVSFAPLNAYERRVIHMALREEPDLRTFSRGDGKDRRLWVGPAEGDQAGSGPDTTAEEE